MSGSERAARPGGPRGEDAALVAAALVGDQGAFGKLVEGYRRELHVHCYRMVGSLEEAEDLVQETFLRGWRRRETYDGRAPFRAWLYKIATNAALDLLAKRPRRFLPHDVGPATDPDGTPSPPADLPWLEPYPDRLLTDADPDPDTAVVDTETIELAFLAAIQHLPPRQRAMFMLRDVLDWSPGEIAAALEVTAASVNSALQRARATLRQHLPRRRSEWTPKEDPSAGERLLLERYMDAVQRGDAAAVSELLAEEVRYSFPPSPMWLDGRAAFQVSSRRFAAAGDHRCVATRANGQPAVALYLRRPGSAAFRPLALEVLRVEGGRIIEAVDFDLPGLFAAFGLPESL